MPAAGGDWLKPEHSQTQEEKDQEQHWHAVDDLRP